MSSIFVGVGQCGNQLSGVLIDYLLSNQTVQSSFVFNHFDGKFHFVNLDSEAKVINNLLAEHHSHLRAENLINTKCGRGSNWASGYSGLKKDGALKIIEQSMEAIRREAERCDILLNFNVMHSLSGGTGSGCGSRLIENLREEYGYKKYIFTQSVAPFKDGELPLQHYNNLLCMSHLHEFVDGICLFQNDDLMNLVEKISSDSSSLTSSAITTKNQLLPFNHSKLKTNTEKAPNSVSLNEMNSYIVKCLLGLILPVDNVSLRSQSFGLELYEIQRFLCSNPNLKIIETYNVNSLSVSSSSSSNYGNSTIKSNPLLKKLFSTVPKYKSNTSEHFTSLNSLIIARGTQDLTEYSNKAVVAQIWQDFDFIKKNLQPVKWNPYTIDLWSSKSSISEPNAPQTNQKLKSNSLTLAVNRNKCVDYLKEIVLKSKEKYAVGAYLHWYEKFNINKDHFQNAFENVNTIIDSYDQMTC